MRASYHDGKVPLHKRLERAIPYTHGRRTTQWAVTKVIHECRAATSAQDWGDATGKERQVNDCQGGKGSEK